MCAIKSYSKLFLILVAAVSSSACCAAQEAYYTIAGDVASPGTYSCPVGEPMDLAKLLERGGVVSDQGIAAILRGPSLETVSTNSVRPDAEPNQTAVAPGDVIVFRRFEPYGNFEQHAVLISGGMPRIMLFSTGGVALEQVLAAAGLQVARRADVVRVQWGTTERLSLHQRELLQHGDVVSVANAGPMSGLRITDTFTPLSVPVMQTEVTTFSLPRSQMESAAGDSQGLIVPPRPQSATLHIPDAFESPDSALSTVSETKTVSTEFPGNSQMELRAPESTENLLTPFRTASLENNLSDTETIQLSDSYPSATAGSSSNAIRDTIFVVGLLFAAGLIGLGWLKTRQERRIEAESAENLQISGATYVAEPELEVAEFTAVEEVELVEAESSRQTVSEDCPLLSAGIEATTTDCVDEADSPWEEMGTLSAATITESAGHETMSADTGPWFAADWSAAEASSETEAGVNLDSSTAPTEAVKSDILEDLLHNRLPMELKQAQLPLQIALFGKPAGPQRIRIDAAHTTIAPPHMASSARRSKQKMPAASDDVQDKQRHRPGGGQSTGSDGSRFDRALNFLEEQSEK